MIRPLLVIILGFVGIQWHDNYTEMRIAEHDAQAARSIAEAVRLHRVECGDDPITLTAR